MAAWSSGAIPIPVSLTAMVMTPSAAVAVRPTRPPSGVNFTALERRFSRICLTFRSSATMSATRGVHGRGERDPVPGRPLPDQGQRIVQGGGQVEPPELQLEPSGLHLGQVEDVVDQGEEMPARGQDVLQVLGLLRVHLPEHPLGEHLREAEDRVQRRPELVGHVGEELGLVAAGGFELPALLPDFPEQPGVLDRERRLGRERHQDVTTSE